MTIRVTGAFRTQFRVGRTGGGLIAPPVGHLLKKIASFHTNLMP